MSKLHRAAARGDAKVVADLLARGRNVNATDEAGRTPLSYAAQSGSLPTALHLLRVGADVHAADPVGRSPLFYAASARAPYLLGALLEAGADPNRADEAGVTPLMAAIGMHIARVVDFCEGPIQFLDTPPELELQTVQNLLGHGADPNQPDVAGRTPAHYAARKLNVAVFSYLCTAKARLDLPDETQWTPVHYAEQNLEIISFDYKRPDLVEAYEAIERMARTGK